jgi:hypothetical protein
MRDTCNFRLSYNQITSSWGNVRGMLLVRRSSLLLAAALVLPLYTVPSTAVSSQPGPNIENASHWSEAEVSKSNKATQLHLVQSDDPGDGYGPYPRGCRNKRSFDACAVQGKGCSLQSRTACAPICSGLCDDP